MGLANSTHYARWPLSKCAGRFRRVKRSGCGEALSSLIEVTARSTPGRDHRKSDPDHTGHIYRYPGRKIFQRYHQRFSYRAIGEHA
jgi:hypothetical protein